MPDDIHLLASCEPLQSSTHALNSLSSLKVLTRAKFMKCVFSFPNDITYKTVGDGRSKRAKERYQWKNILSDFLTCLYLSVKQQGWTYQLINNQRTQHSLKMYLISLMTNTMKTYFLKKNFYKSLYKLICLEMTLGLQESFTTRKRLTKVSFYFHINLLTGWSE